MQDDLFKRCVYGSNWVVNKEGSNKTQYKGPDGRGAVPEEVTKWWVHFPIRLICSLGINADMY